MANIEKYNLYYISGIEEYRRRAMYTLNIKEDCFSVNGIFKSKEFLFDEIVDIKYGEIDFLKETIDVD